jgi:hypothetical protein
VKDKERDALRKTIPALVKKGYVHYTNIEKKIVVTCLHFVTSNTFRKQFYGYLLPNGHIERISRDGYKITPKGKNLEILSERASPMTMRLSGVSEVPRFTQFFICAHNRFFIGVLTFNKNIFSLISMFFLASNHEFHQFLLSFLGAWRLLKEKGEKEPKA